ncbi:MAG: glycosyltransferase family 4 protein, partial [Chloroflexi bacterium]|nr:glycosyltransferase family 4 protein [Chloroflexota bacterium]
MPGAGARRSRGRHADLALSRLRSRLEQCSPAEMASFIFAAAVPAVRLARRLRPDVLHVYFGIPTGPVGWLAARITGAPYLLSLRGGDVPGFLPGELGMIHRLTAPLTSLVWGAAGAIVANSPGLRDLAQRSYAKGHVQMTPNGVDTRFFTPPISRPDGGPLRLLFAGRLVEQKGVTYLLMALPAVAERLGRSVELEIVGSGPLDVSLRAQAAALPPSVTVRFAGWLDRDRLAERYRAADAFVLPSFEEGMPNVVLEAMASGLPIVATDIYGNRDLVTDGDNGLLVPTASPDALADALVRLGADPATRWAMGARSRTRAETQGWDRVAAAYLDMSRT